MSYLQTLYGKKITMKITSRYFRNAFIIIRDKTQKTASLSKA